MGVRHNQLPITRAKHGHTRLQEAESSRAMARPVGLKAFSRSLGASKQSDGDSIYTTEAKRSGGVPIPYATRFAMERAFNHDFADVRVHTDTRAAKEASGLGAQAFTEGAHILFGRGEYHPETSSGQHLLAHELTHVVQQRASGRRLASVPSAGTENGNHEREATVAADGVMARRRVGPFSPAPIGALQRAMICSKRLEAPIAGRVANHAYIDDTGRNDCLGSSKVGNYAVQTLTEGNFLIGCAAKTDTSTDPQHHTPNKKRCSPKAGVADVSGCLHTAFAAYNDPSYYSNVPFPPWGPNSNTFAGTLARACCSDASPGGLGWVPGWDHDPAELCPSARPPAGPELPAIGLPATTLGAGGGFGGLMERDRQRIMEEMRRRRETK